jgi:hypothetical protein
MVVIHSYARSDGCKTCSASVSSLLSLSPRPLLPIPDNPNAVPGSSESIMMKKRRRQLADETLDHVNDLLEVLNGPVSFLPGATAVVSTLQTIVNQIRVSAPV